MQTLILFTGDAWKNVWQKQVAKDAQYVDFHSFIEVYLLLQRTGFEQFVSFDLCGTMGQIGAGEITEWITLVNCLLFICKS